MTDAPDITDVNCNGQPIDRSGVQWCLAAGPAIEMRCPQRDYTAAFGLTRPDNYSVGGSRIALTIKLEVLIPVGAKIPDIDDIARRIIAALPSRPV